MEAMNLKIASSDFVLLCALLCTSVLLPSRHSNQIQGRRIKPRKAGLEAERLAAQHRRPVAGGTTPG
jgi:hypothetical protein